MKFITLTKVQQIVYIKVAFICFVSITYLFALQMQKQAITSNEVKGLILFFDLCIFIPLLYHFTLARSNTSPKFYTVVLFTLGMSTTILNVPSNTLIDQLTIYYLYAASAALASAMLYFWAKFLLALRKYSHIKGEEKLTYIASDIGKNTWFSNVLFAEFLAFYYAFCTWEKLPEANAHNQFSYHQKSGHYGMVVGITVFHIPGIAFFHVLLANVWPEFIFVFTAMHVYTFYLCFAFAKSIKRRLIKIDSQTLHLQCGLLFSNKIDIANIKEAKVVSYSFSEVKAKYRLNACLFGFSNVVVTLHKPMDMQIFSGISQTCDEVVVGVDQPREFVYAVNAARTKDAK